KDPLSKELGRKPMSIEHPRRRRDLCVATLTLVYTVLCLPSAGQAQQTLTAYTSLQKEGLAPYETAFKKAHPEIQIPLVRDPGAVIHSRLLAEKANPRADIIFGLPVTDIVGLYKEGLIEPYAPKNYENLKPRFHDPRNPPVWTGLEMYLNVICFNTV